MAYTSLAFGKYKGTPIDEVPLEYLDWFLGNMKQLRPDTKAMVEASIARRKGSAPAKAPAQPAARPTSGSYDGGGIACPACGAMLDVTLAESQVPF